MEWPWPGRLAQMVILMEMATALGDLLAGAPPHQVDDQYDRSSSHYGSNERADTLRGTVPAKILTTDESTRCASASPLV